MPGKQSKGSVRVRVTTTAEFLTICLAGHQTDVYVSPFLRSSSQCAWQVTERKFTYHHPCRVTHNMPGRPPNGRVRITILTEFLTMCLAGHRKEFHVSPPLQNSSQCAWQATKRTCTYHHSYRVPHNVPSRSPKGSSRITSPAEFLTIYLAGHQTDMYVSPFSRSSSQYDWQTT